MSPPYHLLVCLFICVFVLKQTRLLGNRALQADVFGYLDGVLDSPFFSGDRVSKQNIPSPLKPVTLSLLVYLACQLCLQEHCPCLAVSLCDHVQ